MYHIYTICITNLYKQWMDDSHIHIIFEKIDTTQLHNACVMLHD